MEIAYIYRIEDSLGVGIYFSKLIYWLFNDNEEVDQIRQNHIGLKCPQEEHELDCTIYPQEYCAFKSTKDLVRFMTPKGLEYLVNLGFLVKELVVHKDRCRFGDHQVLFEKAGIIEERILKLT
jgi:hypothetical protein